MQSSSVKTNSVSQIVSMTPVNDSIWIADDKNFVYIWDTMVCDSVVFLLQLFAYFVVGNEKNWRIQN